MNSNIIKTMPEIKLSKDAKNASVDKISNEEILKAAIEHSNLYTNKFTPRNAFIMGAKWYSEQLKLRQ